MVWTLRCGQCPQSAPQRRGLRGLDLRAGSVAGEVVPPLRLVHELAQVVPQLVGVSHGGGGEHRLAVVASGQPKERPSDISCT